MHSAAKDSSPKKNPENIALYNAPMKVEKLKSLKLALFAEKVLFTEIKQRFIVRVRAPENQENKKILLQKLKKRIRLLLFLRRYYCLRRRNISRITVCVNCQYR